MAKMKARTFVDKLHDIVKNHKTLYVLGCFGAPLTGKNVERYKNNYAYNKNPNRSKMIDEAANQNPPVFGFDCVNVGKGLCWGWNGNPDHPYGGAEYNTNGLGDINEYSMIESCETQGADMSKVPFGAAVWLPGHIGYHVGNGKVIECTPRWKNGVQITALSARPWVKWGLLPWLDYSEEEETPEWQRILREKTAEPEQWIAFVNDMKMHHIGKWLPTLIEKLAK